jgi:hypothetical protein
VRNKSLHRYELPEIIMVPVTGGLDRYLRWIDRPDNTCLIPRNAHAPAWKNEIEKCVKAFVE